MRESKIQRVEFADEPPTRIGFMGWPIDDPEFVGVVCSVCGNYGYVPEDAAFDADERGVELACTVCEPVD